MKYEVRIGFQMTCSETKYEKVIFDAESPDEAVEKAKRYGEILRKDFRDEHCTVFISESPKKTVSRYLPFFCIPIKNLSVNLSK